MNRYLFVTFALVLIIISLWTVNFILKDNLDTAGDVELYQINLEIKRLKKENMLLREEVLNARSLRVIGDKARSVGFIPGKIIYLHNHK